MYNDDTLYQDTFLMDEDDDMGNWTMGDDAVASLTDDDTSDDDDNNDFLGGVNDDDDDLDLPYRDDE